MEFSSGSSDDGSGVVILLELFSNLINDLKMTFFDVHLIVLFTNSEEMDLQGAQSFITNHIWRFNIRRFIYIDAISCNEKASLIQIKSSQVLFLFYIDLCYIFYFCSLLLIIVEYQDQVPM